LKKRRIKYVSYIKTLWCWRKQGIK